MNNENSDTDDNDNDSDDNVICTTSCATTSSISNKNDW